MKTGASTLAIHSRRLSKSDRQEQIVLELKLRPHVRISEMAERFDVSSETIRRDMDELGRDGRIDRQHGGASAPSHGHQPGYGERSKARQAEREAIGKTAAALVQPHQTLMIDSGSTTFQMARFIAFSGVPCTVITNSLEVAIALGASDTANVTLCPGQFLPSESAVIGADTFEFLSRHRVDACFIGASGLSDEGIFESVPGFDSIKKAMLKQSERTHLLLDSHKFDTTGFRRIGLPQEIGVLVSNNAPKGALQDVLDKTGVEVLVAREPK